MTYVPKWVRYSSPLFHNTVDQDASLGANFSVADWQYQFSQAFSDSAQPLIETGRQTSQESYGTDLKALYGIGISQAVAGGHRSSEHRLRRAVADAVRLEQ